VATEVGFAHAFSFSERLLTAFVIAATYARDLVAPEFGLNLEPPLEMAGHLHDLRFLGGFAVVVIWIGATVWARRRHEVLAFASAWALVALLPVLNLVPIETLLAERFLYIPSAAYALVLAVVLLAPRTPMFAAPARISRVGLGIVLLVVALYLPNTVTRNTFWNDDVTLWTAKLKEDPDSIRAYRNLARFHLRAGNKTPALEALEQIVRLDPESGLSHYNLGVYQVEEGRLPEARESFAASVAADPDYPPAHYNLGRVLLSLGDREGGQRHLREAVRLDPDFEDARWWLESSSTRNGS
jgi:tetratricopeptide (TPR) repeat protein